MRPAANLSLSPAIACVCLHVNTESTTWRLFVAIPLPDAVRREIERAQAELRRALPEDCVRWTRPGQFHLTLVFLGNVEVNRVDELAASLRNACAGCPVLGLKAERIGFFPPAGFPRVVWASVRDAAGQLQQVQAVVSGAVQPWTQEQRKETFTGHVTLGRCRVKRREAEVLSKLAASMADRVFGEWVARDIELVRSELSPNGSRYTVVATASLAEEIG